jgi:hypothetical protein
MMRHSLRGCVAALITLVAVLTVSPASAHGTTPTNSTTLVTYFNVITYAQISLPGDGDTFGTTDTITFASASDHKITIHNTDTTSAHTIYFDYWLELRAGTGYGNGAVLDSDNGENEVWGLSANQTRTIFTALAHQWNGTAADSYFSKAIADFLSGTFGATVDHSHGFTVQ